MKKDYFEYKLPNIQPKTIRGWNGRIRSCESHIESMRKTLNGKELTTLQRKNIKLCLKARKRYLQLLISERNKFIDPLPIQYLTN